MEKKKHGFVAQVGFASQAPAILINWEASENIYEKNYFAADEAGGVCVCSDNTTCWD